MPLDQGAEITPGKAAAAFQRARDGLDRLRAQREAHAAARPDCSELEPLVQWKQRDGHLALQIEAAEEVLQAASAATRREEEAAAAAEHARRGKEAEALASKHADLTRKIARDAVALARQLADLEDMRDRITAAGVVDGEARIRTTPRQVQPACFQEVEVWRDREGNQPVLFRRDERGEQVPSAGRNLFAKRKERVLISEEREIPARMPERFADAFRLVDLEGTQIWPLHDRNIRGDRL